MPYSLLLVNTFLINIHLNLIIYSLEEIHIRIPEILSPFPLRLTCGSVMTTVSFHPTAPSNENIHIADEKENLPDG